MSNVVLVVHLDIQPEHTSEFVDIVAAHGKNTEQSEEGCLGFAVLRPRCDPNRIILVETYRDDAALETHWASEHMTQYLERVKDMIAHRSRYRCDPSLSQ